MSKDPVFLFGIAQKPKGIDAFDPYFFLFNAGESPILDIRITKRGEFYYLVDEMKIVSELQLDAPPWWEIDALQPKERKIKKTRGLEVCHLPARETALFAQNIPATRQPIRFIVWLEIAYTEEGEGREEMLLCALEPDGVNLLPVLTSEDPYKVISERLKQSPAPEKERTV